MVELEELQGTNKRLMEELQHLRAVYQKQVRREVVRDGDAGSQEVVICVSVPSISSPKKEKSVPDFFSLLY